MAHIRKRYNQVQHLTQDTTWECNKNTINITNKSQEVSPLPAGDHNKQTQKHDKHKTQKRQMIHKKYRLGTVSKSILLESLYWFHSANLTLSSDVVQDTKMFDLRKRPLAYQYIISKNI